MFVEKILCDSNVKNLLSDQPEVFFAPDGSKKLQFGLICSGVIARRIGEEIEPDTREGDSIVADADTFHVKLHKSFEIDPGRDQSDGYSRNHRDRGYPQQ